MHSAYARRVGDEPNGVRYDRLMTAHRNLNAETAVQYLVWALELIEKTGNQKAARHVHIAVDALRKGTNKPDGQAI
jgi:hypothetical protein